MIEALEIKTFMLFNLDFAHKMILSELFFFFLIIDLYFLIPAAIAQIFNPITELLNPTGMQSSKNRSKAAKTEIEIHQVIVESKMRKYSI